MSVTTNSSIHPRFGSSQSNHRSLESLPWSLLSARVLALPGWCQKQGHACERTASGSPESPAMSQTRSSTQQSQIVNHSKQIPSEAAQLPSELPRPKRAPAKLHQCCACSAHRRAVDAKVRLDVAQAFPTIVLKSQALLCRNGCALSGNPSQGDDHQARVCPRRIIACLLEGRLFTRPAVDVQDQYISYQLMRVHCTKYSFFALRLSKMTTHDRVKELK